MMKLPGIEACNNLNRLCSSTIRVLVHALIYTIPHRDHLSTGKVPSYPDDVFGVAFQRFKSKVFSEHFVPYKFYPRRCQFEPTLDGEKVFLNKVNIEKASHELIDVSREAYSIDIVEDGTTLLKIDWAAFALLTHLCNSSMHIPL